MCPETDLSPGDARVVDARPPIAVFNVNGDLYATDDTCTHEKSSLAEGFLEGDIVECAFHFARFCVRTGEALTPPATVDLAVHRVTVRDGMICVRRGSEPDAEKTS